MTLRTQASILQDVRDLLHNFDGKEYSGNIAAETLLFADLGMDSIGTVILGETLEKLYERQFPFGEFLAELNREGATDVCVGRLVAFLYQDMVGHPGESQPCR
jgi:acyl carrier protein